ncbi:hypothetical protein, partial [Pseudoduganella dura]|uniref:hypothetical protein n=1 Tax=Pseudoduganella dura TaxID=321982 RepID=UPI001E502B47
LLFGHFARQLWPATLFRDAQAAVVTGNGFRMESFRRFSRKNFQARASSTGGGMRLVDRRLDFFSPN